MIRTIIRVNETISGDTSLEKKVYKVLYRKTILNLTRRCWKKKKFEKSKKTKFSRINRLEHVTVKKIFIVNDSEAPLSL